MASAERIATRIIIFLSSKSTNDVFALLTEVNLFSAKFMEFYRRIWHDVIYATHIIYTQLMKYAEDKAKIGCCVHRNVCKYFKILYYAEND